MRLKKIKLINRILTAENDLKFICEGLSFLKNTKKNFRKHRKQIFRQTKKTEKTF